jgi:hypothetical protein
MQKFAASAYSALLFNWSDSLILSATFHEEKAAHTTLYFPFKKQKRKTSANSLKNAAQQYLK